MKRVIVVFAGVVAVMGLPMVATAHNAGHIFLPDGTCLVIGSLHDAPLVGPGRTQLDLVPETPNPPFDEIGVSFVGHNARTPIFPSAMCQVGAPGLNTLQDASGLPMFMEISY